MKPYATRASFDAIKREVCAEFRIDEALFDSASRLSIACGARRLAWWRARHRSVVSFPQLGAWSGGRDPTTVWHGVRSLDAWLQGQEFQPGIVKRERARARYQAKKAKGEI